MSLDNAPKIDWETSDGVSNTDLNNIGKNLNELEDSKYESGDSPTFATETVTTSNITTGNITTVNSSTINNSGFVKSNFKSSDGTVGINDSFSTGITYTLVFKDGLLISRT